MPKTILTVCLDNVYIGFVNLFSSAHQIRISSAPKSAEQHAPIQVLIVYAVTKVSAIFYDYGDLNIVQNQESGTNTDPSFLSWL